MKTFCIFSVRFPLKNITEKWYGEEIFNHSVFVVQTISIEEPDQSMVG